MDKLTYTSFASSSAGNSGVVSCGGTHILLDVGISARRVRTGLESIGLAPSDVAAILITHGHSDHVKGLEVFRKCCGAPVYFTGHGFLCGDRFSIGCIEVAPFRTPHDADGSAGFRFSCEGGSLGFATDLGYMSDEVFRAVSGADAVVLESNYDADMLRTGPYPYALKRRIASATGHLCNDDAAEAAGALSRGGRTVIALAHLSKENNTPETAFATVSARVPRGLSVLPRDCAATISAAADKAALC